LNRLKARCLLMVPVLALVLGCPPQQEPQAPAPAPVQAALKLEPWTWHRLGGLLVVEGEVEEPTDLRIKGRYLNEYRHAEYGPVRWEMYAPPPGEVAELRTTDGKLLAHWDFNASSTRQTAPAAKSRLLAKGKPEPKMAFPSQPGIPSPRVPGPAPQPVMAHRNQPSSLPSLEPLLLPPRPEVAVKPPVPLPLDLDDLPASPSPAQGWPGAGESFNLLRGPKSGRQICLTFDGGSSSEAAQDVLDALKEHGIRTTFFLTGVFIHKYPELVRRMAREGHEIGNHTQDHPHFAPGFRRDPKWTKARFQQELLQADSALLQLLGRPMDPYWRAPYGEQTGELRAWAEELGYRHVGWSEGADTLDWATPKQRKLYRTGDAILDRLRERMERRDGEGLIVLMHLGSERPVADRPASVLAPFLDQALHGGWHFVNVGTYMQASGKPRWEPSNRLALLGHSNLPLHTASKR